MTRLLPLAALLLAFGLALRADEPKKTAEPKAVAVPFRLTQTKHLLVRAKINNKGPFNFILDTGAPALYIATPAAEKAGLKGDKNDWGVCDRFEIEGGIVLNKQRIRVEEVFQLKGMNGLGLAGVELHGIIGYTVLARHRLEIDLTRDKMLWTKLNFDPGEPVGMGKAAAPPGMDAVAGVMKMAGGMMGKKIEPEQARGHLGLHVKEEKDGLTVTAVLARSPAATAGFKIGDRIREFQGKTVENLTELHKAAATVTAGDNVTVSVGRDSKTETLKFKAGEGL